MSAQELDKETYPSIIETYFRDFAAGNSQSAALFRAFRIIPGVPRVETLG